MEGGFSKLTEEWVSAETTMEDNGDLARPRSQAVRERLCMSGETFGGASKNCARLNVTLLRQHDDIDG